MFPLPNISGGLDVELGESGKDLSAGQQQLLCLARALVSNARVSVQLSHDHQSRDLSHDLSHGP